MSYRGSRGGYGGGYGGRRGGDRGGRGRSRGRNAGGEGRGAAAEPKEKAKPTFIQLERLVPNRSSFVLVKLSDTQSGVQRLQRGRGRGPVSVTCTQSKAGDATGWIYVFTTDDTISTFLKDNDGKVVALMNIRSTVVDGNASVELDKFSTLKTLEQVQEEKLLADNASTTFDINSSVDLAKKPLRKPTFLEIANLKPEGKGINVIGKVASVNFSSRDRSDGSQRIAEAVIGNDQASINLTARCADLSALEVGKTVAVMNAKVEMYNQSNKLAHMRLGASMWSCIKPISEIEPHLLPAANQVPNDETKVNVGNNRSSGTWELQDQ